MSCHWIDTEGHFASDQAWEKHIESCTLCQTELMRDDEVSDFFRAPVTVPDSVVDGVMARIDEHTKDLPKKRPGMGRYDRSGIRGTRVIKIVAAAALVGLLGATFHTPLAKAANRLIQEISTTFFPQTEQPVQVKVSQVSPQQSASVQKDLLSQDQMSRREVFNKHRQEIIATYNQLQNGMSRGLKFADGTGFDVVKQPVFTKLADMRVASRNTLPILADLPGQLAFDRGIVRMSGDGKSVAEMDILFTPGAVTHLPMFEYQRYTDPSFSVAKGMYLHLNMVVADGVISTEYPGDFQSKEQVDVQGHPGVLMQYSNTWKPEPGITRIVFGVTKHGHNYTLQLSGRDITPNQMLQIANNIHWGN